MGVKNFVDYDNAQAITNKIAQKINALGGAYIFKGSIPFASLPATITSDMAGYTYNITNDFTTDARFVEGAGFDYKAGTNVSVADLSTYVEVTPVGSESPATEGWYELVNNKYIPSTDAEVVSGKTYYARTSSVKFDIVGSFFDMDAINDRIDGAEGMVAPEFDQTQAYAIGAIVTHEDGLYKFKAAHVANTAWNSSEVDETAITDLISSAEPDSLTNEQVAALIAILN